jgi:hypothetical protein
MGGVIQRRVFGAAVTGMIVVGIVGVTSFSASGESANETTDPVPLAPYGTLTIDLNGRSGSYKLVDPDGKVIQLETPNANPETIVTGPPCAAVQPGTGRLLRLTPNPVSPTSASDTVQLRDSAIGVNTGNTSCGTSNAAVISRSEQLKIELGDVLPDGVQIKSASLQVKKLRSGNLRYVLDTGFSGQATISQNPQQVLVAPTINSEADLFTSITLESTSTKDNEGLSIFTGTSFELLAPSEFEFAVDCGEKVTVIGAGEEVDDETGEVIKEADIAQSAVFLRGENGVKSGECVDVGVIVEIQDDTTPGVTEDRVFWNNAKFGVDGTTPQDVQGLLTIVWSPVADLAELEREIDYDGFNGPAPYTDVLWCESFSQTSETTFTGVLPPIGVGTPGANLDGTAPWCLVSNEEVLNSAGEIVQTQVFYGSGDPTIKTKSF